MNRSERRLNKARAVARLQNAKAYCLITYDGNSLPVFHFDMTACDDHDDVRHVAMHAASEAAISRLSIAQVAVDKKAAALDQAERVSEAKEKRSEELADPSKSYQGEEKYPHSPNDPGFTKEEMAVA
ncbi:MAG: hypothetical protein EHM32_01110 [Spirochaetales bacterium]|nr:MAG: hypothetical protein EHM66_00410 [Deltaproteobacteria bacterium]RPI97632.1 MAG: hypothetical protein EHM32_01110 [Spirochaetales bacterium]